jgi:hypothetical protein
MRALALAWLREEDWPTWLSIDQDFQPDYQHWLRRMEAKFKELQDAGHPVEKVVIEPAECVAWCRAQGRKVDSQGRAGFAAYKIMRHHTDH